MRAAAILLKLHVPVAVSCHGYVCEQLCHLDNIGIKISTSLICKSEFQ